MKNRNVFCASSSGFQRDAILRDLQAAEFSMDEISLLFLASAGRPPERMPFDSEWPFKEYVRKRSTDSIVAAGPVAAALNGRHAGGIAGGLAPFGVPDREVEIYSRVVERGGTLIAVHTGNPEKAERARLAFNMARSEGVVSMMVVEKPRGPARISQLER